ncbi:Suppressor of the cold-sensitive snRNP bioproteinsis mutant brr1-1, partial [Perkinsus olseni]
LIAARRNNNLDMVGMSPNVRLVSFRTHEDNGAGSWANVAEAMDMAVDIGIDVVSISLGHFMSQSYAEQIFGKAFKAATDQGIIIVASAGNDGKAADTHYPSALPGVIAVASIDIQDTLQLSSFSNYGGYVDIAAYGSDVYTGYNRLASGT